jgi:VWFA-related protein
MRNRAVWFKLGIATAVGCGLLTVAGSGQIRRDGSDDKPLNPDGSAIFRSNVQNIVAPVTVFGPDGQLMDNLQPSQFHLYDNGREQDIHVDTEFQPISLVIAIEASYRDDAILKQIHKAGALIQPLVVGTGGEVAVIGFDSRIQTYQDFTSDPQKIEDAIGKVHGGSYSSRMIDAVDTSVRMLSHRPRDRRRIILLISETRDNGSEARGRQTLIDLQLQNVTLYSVDITQFARRLTETPDNPRPSAIAPEALNLPMGANTPLGVQQATGSNGNSAEFVPVLKEIYTDAKGIFIKNPVKIFTQGTGGEQTTFVKQRGLEDAIEKIGAQIHSQYLISYRPRQETLLEGGFHEIAVRVDYPRAVAKTRPGYWLAGVNQ